MARMQMGEGSAPVVDGVATTLEPDAAVVPHDDFEVYLLPVDAIERQPTAIENAADPADLLAIRQRFGSLANTIINMLLCFDAYFAWYFPYKKSVPLYSTTPVQEARALVNMQTAINMHEILERVSIRAHGSFLFHGAIFKVTSDILTVGDVHAFRLSRLELHQAHLKRTTSRGASRTLTLRESGKARAPALKYAEGPSNLGDTGGYKTTLVLSTFIQEARGEAGSAPRGGGKRRQHAREQSA
jgi:hypothetical protein